MNAPTAPMPWRERVWDLSEAGRTALLRLVGLAYVVFTVLVWGLVMGIDMPGIRAEISGSAVTLAVVLAVLCPVTALGLWSLAAWGQVMWAVTMAVHVAAVLNGWTLSAQPGMLLAFHVACVTTFAVAVLARLVANKG